MNGSYVVDNKLELVSLLCMNLFLYFRLFEFLPRKNINTTLGHVQTVLSLIFIYFENYITAMNVAIAYYLFDSSCIIISLATSTVDSKKLKLLFLGHHLISLYFLSIDDLVITVFNIIEISNLSLIFVYYLRKSRWWNNHFYFFQFLWYSYLRLIHTLPYHNSFHELDNVGKVLILLLYIGSAYWSFGIIKQWITFVKKKLT
jgi:hypothetical protein